MRRNLIRYFIIVFKIKCDIRIEKMINFQFFSIYYYINYILFYYIKNYFKKALKLTYFLYRILFYIYFNNLIK